MRLIDADALKKETGKWLTNPTDSRLLADVIGNAPTIDAVPIVQCKDCKWHQDNATWEDFINHCKWISTETPDDDDFCSCGERKDNETI